MKKIFLSNITILAFCFIVFALSTTYSSFSSSASNVNNVFASGQYATPTPTPTPTPTTTPSPTPPIAQTLVINEVMSHSSCSQGQTEAQWLEVYNGFSTTVNLKNFKITDGTNTIDLVSASSSNIAPGSLVLLAHSASIFGNDKCFGNNGVSVENLGGNLNINVGHLQLLDGSNNVIDDVQWNGGTGLNPLINQSIERTTLGQDSATGSSFNASDFGVQCPSTPGNWTTPTSSCPVVINELMWMGSKAFGTDDEWLELRNTTANPIDLGSWKIVGAVSGSGAFSVSGTIPANGLFLISHFNAVSSAINVTPDIDDTTIQLDNTNAQYTLVNNHGNIVDVADDSSGTPLTGANPSGNTNPKKSMERKTPPGDGTQGSNWQTATTHAGMDGSTTSDDFGTPKNPNP